MNQYIIDTEYAVSNLFALATTEAGMLTKLIERLQNAEAERNAYEWDFRTSDLNEDFSERHVMGAFDRAAKAAKAADELKAQVVTLNASIGGHEQAVLAIYGGILQIARQGISLVHGKKDMPAVRKIGSLPIQDIIRAGRNQAMHYEEGNYQKFVTKVFDVLEQEQGGDFSLAKHGQGSLAAHIFRLLSWTSYERYLEDMGKLLLLENEVDKTRTGRSP